jgi:membrane-associated phospholipid phosphatase
MLQHRVPSSRKLTLIGASIALLLVIAFGIAIGTTRGSPAPPIDQWWEQVMLGARNPAFTSTALVLNYVGTGLVSRIIVPVVVIAALLFARKPWGALVFVIATILSVVAVQITKRLVGRPRPLHALVTSDLGSFPSGHVANAATLVVVLALITRLAWVWVVGSAYVLLMMLSRTYLGIHWLTDTIGGLVLGAAVALIVAAIFATLLARERPGPKTRPS